MTDKNEKFLGFEYEDVDGDKLLVDTDDGGVMLRIGSTGRGFMAVRVAKSDIDTFRDLVVAVCSKVSRSKHGTFIIHGTDPLSVDDV